MIEHAPNIIIQCDVGQFCYQSIQFAESERVKFSEEHLESAKEVYTCLND